MNILQYEDIITYASINPTTGVNLFTNTRIHQNISHPSECSLKLGKTELPVILLVTLVINVLAFAVLIRMRGTCDTLDHHLVSLLNVNDLISTVIFTIMWLSGWASCNQLLQLPIYCGIFGWLGSALVVWSAGIIVIMTSCRYLSLVKPLYYRTNVKVTSVTRAVVGTLIFCLLFFIWPFTGLTAPFTLYEDNHICTTQFAPGGAGLGQRIFIGVTGVAGCLTVVHVLVCNLTIVKTLRQRNAIQSDGGGSVRSDTRTNFHGKRRKFGHVTLVVSFVYALCYAPFVVRLVIDTINDISHQDSLLHSVTLSLLFLSPLLNPIVYGVFNKQFRMTLFSFFRLSAQQKVQTPGQNGRPNQFGGVYLQRGACEGQRVKVPPDRSTGSLSEMLDRQCRRSSVMQLRETEVTITGYASSIEMFTFSCE